MTTYNKSRFNHRDQLIHVRKTVAFDGTAGNGAVGTVTLFTISGRVIVERFTAYVTEDIATVGASLTVGTTAAGNSSSMLNTLVTSATAGTWLSDYWGKKAGSAPVGPNDGSTFAVGAMAFALDITATVVTNAITDGTIVFDIFYRPLTDGATLTAA